jgi:hypothetical protein
MGDWIKYHSDHFNCNKFEEVSKTKEFKDGEDERKKAINEQKRYEFFYLRY